MLHPIHTYRPQRTEPEDLEAIFVAREDFLGEILRRLKQWQPGTTRQHYLIIGPRGIGKTYLLMLLQHRIRQHPELSKRWYPIALGEETYGTTRVADLLIEALRILADETGDAAIEKTYDDVRFDDDDARVTDLSLDAFRRFHKSRNCGILLMVENVNRVFERQMRDRSEIHLLRKILIEEEWLWALCTSPTYLNAVTEPEEPLFEFFHVELLTELTPEQQEQMLQKLAILDGKVEFVSGSQGLRSRLRALYHFTGGNPRLTVMLYELVANQNITDVKTELDLLLDQLTPFYQDRMKEIGQQEGKLLEGMALMQEGCTPTELAEETRLEGKLVRALLTRLERGGYVRREPRRRKRTVYIIPERFFRIWHQMNHSRAARGRVQHLLEFFSTWYSTKPERDRVWDELMAEFEIKAREGDDDRAKDLAEYMEYVEAVSEGSERLRRVFDRLRSTADHSGLEAIRQELLSLDQEHQTDGDYFVHKSYFLANDLVRPEEALDAFRRSIELKQDDIVPLFNEAVALDKLGREQEARKTYGQAAAMLSRQHGREAIREAQDPLLQILREDTDFHTVRMVAYLLGRTASIDVASHIMTIMGTPGGVSWRGQHCATALGLLGAEDAIPFLLECLHNEAANVRGSTATALGRIGSEQAVEPLIECLNDPASNVRGSAATALGWIGSEQAAEPLIEHLKDSDHRNRASAATALGKIGSEQAIAPLMGCLKDSASNVRGSAATALGHIGSEEAIVPLIECLNDAAPINRGSAATALGYIGSKQAIEPLTERLDDPASKVRGSAATALGRIGSEQEVKPLIKCLKDSVDDVRGGAATAFGRIGSEQAVEPLIECLKDSAPINRGSAATALGAIGAERSIEPLIECLNDPDPINRGSAAAALGRIGSAEAARALIECLNDPAKEVRGSAIKALGRIASESPILDLPRVIYMFIEEFGAALKPQMASIIRALLRSAFRSANLDMIGEAIEVVKSGLTNAEALYAPYIAALKYLESDRDPAVMERQQPEMREAIQLLVGAFDECANQ